MATNPVDMNQTVTSPTEPVSNTQDSDAQKDVRVCKEYYRQGKAARSTFDADWGKRRDYYLGKQWSNEKYSSLYKSKPVMNILRQTVQSQLPILTDARPGFSVLPKEPSDFEFADMLGELTSMFWDNSGMDLVLIEALMDEMILDAGLMKVSWDPEAEDGAGDLKVECVNPDDVFVPYGAVDFTKNCPWVLHRVYKSVADLKNMFPKFKDEIKADPSTGNDKNSAKISDEVHLVSPVDRYSPPDMGGSPTGEADQRKVCEVWEVWTKSDEYEEIVSESGEKVTKKKYPRGCIITMLPNQNLRLQKVPHPYRHGRWPFVRFVDSILPRQFWGDGECRSLMQTQRMVNKVLASMFDCLNLMSNPVWMIEEDCGVDAQHITNQVASVLTLRPGSISQTKIRRDFAPALQSGIVDLYNLIMRQAEMTSGTSEVSQGRKPPGVSAAAAIETLQEASQTRIRLKERNMQVSLQQLGQQMIGLMMQYYSEPRVARVTGKDQQWPKYFEFFIEDVEEPDSMSKGYVFNRKEYTFDEESRQYMPGEYKSTMPTKGLMDVRVMSGTAMPWSKTSRANIAFKLFDSQVIDRKELLDALEWPNADKVVERLEAQEQAAAAEGGGPEGEPLPPQNMTTAGGG